MTANCSVLGYAKVGFDFEWDDKRDADDVYSDLSNVEYPKGWSFRGLLSSPIQCVVELEKDLPITDAEVEEVTALLLTVAKKPTKKKGKV